MWVCVFFFKQKTAYEMRISDWSSDVCSSDLSLAQLTRAANRFREFDYATPITVTSRIAEVSALAESFRSLQETLNRYDSLLHQIGRASCRVRECQSV